MSKIYQIEPGYFGSSPNNIIILENFIQDNDLKIVQDYCFGITEFKSIPQDHWDNRVHTAEILEKTNKKIFNILVQYQMKLKNEIENKFNIKLSDNSPSIVIWRPGDDQQPHADKQEQDGSPNPYPENDIASLFYLNDNYDGGEIYFTNQKISIKPNAGSAVFFPGDINYTHGVTEVKKNNRFTSPSFWKSQGFV
jgi:predicted 2-oxoglutarate/Fe(II)-dependent dioxygenase YbiX